MRLEMFDRIDFLLTKALLAVVGVAVPMFSLGLPLLTWLRNRPLRWELDGLGVTEVPIGLVPHDGVTLLGTESIAVRIEDAGTSAWMASLLPGALLSVAVGIAAWLLLRLVQRIEKGKPFVAASAVALRLLGATIVLGSLAVSLGLGFADAVIARRALEVEQLSMSLEMPLVAFIVALLVLAVAEAFAQGARLQDDVEGLV